MKYSSFVKYALLLLLIISFSDFSYGQFYFGGKTGVLFSTQKFDDKTYKDSYKVGYTPGYSIGGALNFTITENFDLYHEFNFSKKRFKIQSKEYQDVNNLLVFNYFDFPVLLRTKIYKHPVCDIFFEMGPTIGYWYKGRGVFKAEELDEYNLDKAEYDLVWDVDSTGSIHNVYITEANRLQFSLNLGLGGKLKLRNGNLILVDLRYEMGHTFISRSPEKIDYLGGGYQHDFKANNQSIILSTAYLISTKSLMKRIKR